jgi:hypothetical protein
MTGMNDPSEMVDQVENLIMAFDRLVERTDS